MKRFLMVALVGLASAFPLASAQDEAEPFLGGGFGVLFVDGNTLTGITLQGGADNLIGSLTLRGNFDIGISDGFFGFSADVLTRFPAEEINPYAGGGFGLFNLNDSFFQIHATGGLEFFVADNTALFLELQPTYFLTSSDFGASFRFGANYHLE